MNMPSLLIQSLQNPTLFPHKVEYFKIIETHISWILLTGSYAYKIKKPLNLGFLDFSSLKKRQLFCLEEIRLNSRLAPNIYLEVVAISGTEHQPILNHSHSGTVIEYAVKMHQFEQDKTFDQLLMQNQLTNQHIKQTAKIIANFHNRIERAAKDSKFGSSDAVLQPVQENFRQILQQHRIDKTDVLKHLKSWSEQQHTTLLPLFKQRKQDGFIRECHGDLHLGNIALIDAQAVPFDGIEFNPALYWIDVISEIAFLVMDLQDKQRHDLAFQFLNTYLQYSGDYNGLKLLHFYLVYRAIIRAKVCAIRAGQCISKTEHHQIISYYNGYLQLANSYTQSTASFMIIMHGLSGSGKSWLSEKISNRFQAIRIRSDVERKRLHNLEVQQKGHSAIACELYSQASNDITYQHLLNLSGEIVSAGYNVIVDATFLQQQHRKLFFQKAEQLQIAFLIVQTQSNKQTLIQRIKDRYRQHDNVSEADQAVLEYQLSSSQPLTNEELTYCATIDTTQITQLPGLWKRIAHMR